MLKPLLLVTGLVSLPAACFAQTPAPQPRYYVGAGASLLSIRPFGSSYDGPALVGPAFTVGRPLTARVALQANVGLHAGRKLYGGTAIASTALLLRYTLTSATSRLQVDGLAGVTLLSYGLTLSGEGDRTTSANFSLGPSLRYTLAPHLELLAMAPVNVTPQSPEVVNLLNHFSLSAQVGVSYLVGR